VRSDTVATKAVLFGAHFVNFPYPHSQGKCGET
jgi:hypothetical protein